MTLLEWIFVIFALRLWAGSKVAHLFLLGLLGYWALGSPELPFSTAPVSEPAVIVSAVPPD